MIEEERDGNRLILQGATQTSVCSLLEKNPSCSLLVEVSLDRCLLTTVPESLSALQCLEILDLCNNAITFFEPGYNTFLPNHCWNHLKLFAFFSSHCVFWFTLFFFKCLCDKQFDNQPQHVETTSFHSFHSSCFASVLRF